MIKRLLFGVIALFAAATACCITLAALSFALYAVLLPHMGRAGAAAAVAGVYALIMVLAAVGLALAAKPPRRREASPIERFAEMARERPILAAVSALGAGLVALKNPQIIAGIVSAILAGKAAGSDRRR